MWQASDEAGSGRAETGYPIILTSMNKPRIVNRGDGPKIEGTRITVYTVLDYLNHGRSRDWIAATLALSSKQVEAATEYIRQHKEQVMADYEKILARISRGNPPWVKERQRKSSEKLKSLKEELRSARIGVPADADCDAGIL